MPFATSQNTWTRIRDTFRWSINTTVGLYRAHHDSFYVMQIGYYSTIVGAALLARRYPSLREASIAKVNADLDYYEAGRYVTKVYEDGQIVYASLVTFIINLTVGSGLVITAPSFLLPFSGLASTAYRAVAWGFLFAAETSIWHYATLVIEGQAYVLAAWASWIQSTTLVSSLREGRMFTQVGGKDDEDEAKPQGVRAWWKQADWKTGWEATKAIYGPITTILLVSACWEAFEVIHLLDSKSVKLGQV